MAVHSAQKMRRIVAEAATIDPKFAPLIERRPLCALGRSKPTESHFESLVSSVISQQLATKAAATIHDRLVKLCNGSVTPRKLVKLSDEQLREIGVSGAKTRTIKGIATAALDKSIPINEIDQIHDDQEIFDALTSIWGVGRWTVEMFMMFRLGRLDVWPIGDLGVRRGWGIIQGLGYTPTEKEVIGVTDHLSPYRSVVAWHCWRATDEEPDFW